MPLLKFDPGAIVHVLTYGVALCQNPGGLPHQWPVLNKWVRASDWENVPVSHRCPRCSKRMEVDGPRLIQNAMTGRTILQRNNACHVKGCALLSKHYGDHVDKDGKRLGRLG